jgi:hypothetical protein
MVSPFEAVAKKMVDLGFYSYIFPFIITSAIFYALIKRSKLFGESVTASAAVALSAEVIMNGKI